METPTVTFRTRFLSLEALRGARVHCPPGRWPDALCLFVRMRRVSSFLTHFDGLTRFLVADVFAAKGREGN